MRLVRFPDHNDNVKLINADLVSKMSLYPYPEDHAYWEVSIEFGADYDLQWVFRNIGDARQLIADIAGCPLEDVSHLLT